LRALKLFKGLWKVAVGLVETSLAPLKEFETEGERTSSALPPRTGMSRAAVGIVVGENREMGGGEERVGWRGEQRETTSGYHV
jgi:hypothetical protein